MGELEIGAGEYACNPRIWKAEVEEQGFKASLVYKEVQG